MLPLHSTPSWMTWDSAKTDSWRGASKGVGKTSAWPQVAPGSRQETVSMPASETLIFWAEIRGRITLGNSVGNTDSTLKRFQCEILVCRPDGGHAFTLLTTSQSQRHACLHLKDKQEFRLSYDTTATRFLPRGSSLCLVPTPILVHSS